MKYLKTKFKIDKPEKDDIYFLFLPWLGIRSENFDDAHFVDYTIGCGWLLWSCYITFEFKRVGAK